MANARFLALLDELSKQCGAAEAGTLRETGLLSIDDINFTLTHVDEFNPDVLFVLCELGPMADADETECYRRMLQMNFFLSYQVGPQMVLDPQTNAPLLISRLALNELTAENMLAGMRESARLAQRWRSGELFTNPFAVAA